MARMKLTQFGQFVLSHLQRNVHKQLTIFRTVFAINFAKSHQLVFFKYPAYKN